jgi:ADP-ribose pyrophosphatase
VLHNAIAYSNEGIHVYFARGLVAGAPALDQGEFLDVTSATLDELLALARVMLEFPAGKIDAGETPAACAVRELAEETGYHAREWAHAGVLHNAIAYSNEGIHVYFARGLVVGQPALDHGEFLDVASATLEELLALARSGELTDAKTLIGLLWLQNWQSGQWPLDWGAAP